VSGNYELEAALDALKLKESPRSSKATGANHRPLS
jgi:hypothetical protein